ncbi:M23 family metallopeptidase [Propionibacterium freudenreichii]|uniref:M23 family metallopeptidase n=1 Tax=Propionibacterium freudenreichii TaxID=1744 RepID=UPI00254E73C3|nr:M23 family metallopeptidase [Propionibacterium freudenreichii]MDK9332051.1 M23 family metallopeptidase [Propionibacterium freudenreichii]
MDHSSADRRSADYRSLDELSTEHHEGRHRPGRHRDPAGRGGPSTRTVEQARALRITGMRRRACAGHPLGAPRAAVRTLLVCLLTCLALMCPVGAWAQQVDGELRQLLPLDGPVSRDFRAPDKAWSAGHRGVDLSASEGTPVRAAAAGTISHVGTIAGVRTVSVTHADGLRTTYQPVDPQVRKGERVAVGQVIGTLLSGHGPTTSLHWGLLRGKEYLDPMEWLSGRAEGRVRLLAGGTTVKRPVPEGWSGLMEAGVQILSPSGTAVMPADGPLTSPFGSRTNPVLDTTEVHDGLDIGAPCGAPVRAAWAGTVRYSSVMSGFGNRVEIDHGGQPHAAAASSYNHMADAGVGLVRVGDRVQAGQVIGLVGTTGLSTGCHLHFSTYTAGRAVDPRPFL